MIFSHVLYRLSYLGTGRASRSSDICLERARRLATGPLRYGRFLVVATGLPDQGALEWAAVSRLRFVVAFLSLAVAVAVGRSAQEPREWLAGDSHIHSHWSPSYDRTQDPPVPRQGGDAIYSTPLNARMARQFGLSWMVTTDHGGPNHSKFSRDQAYPELMASRQAVPEVMQFYGMELNMPAMDHHTLIIPRTSEERAVLFEVERRFDKNEAHPVDATRDTADSRERALSYIATLQHLPVLFVNHPSRSATGLGEFGLDEPSEIRANNDLAPAVYRGMEGAPGHQAGGLDADGNPRRDAAGEPVGGRGLYATPGAGTLGGFDQMTAIVGGVWDALLGEGRRFWIVASSDSHVHYTEGSRRGNDFWPGEFQKTYVHARRDYDDVLDGLRNGRVFAVAGDLVTSLDVVVTTAEVRAEIGGTLIADPGAPVEVEIRFRDPDVPNGSGSNPRVARVDLIFGEVGDRSPGADENRNETTRVLRRFARDTWTQDGDVFTVRTDLPRLDTDAYIRVRGTSTDDLEPGMDGLGEDPWTDLWFYSNPVFIEQPEQN